MNNGNSGLAEERLLLIRNFIKNSGIASVDDLCEELGVSGATIRRDLAELASRGEIKRVHGGAISIEASLGEPVFDDKTKIASYEKRVIAEAALKLINPNDSIYLDGGSTVHALARLLTGMDKLTVVTNSLRVATTLSSAGPRIILTGGELRKISQTFVGAMTKHIIEKINVDKAFMGTIGLKDGTLTTTDPAEAFTKEIVMQRARKIYLLADSSKLEEASLVKFGEAHEGLTIITDAGIAKSHEKFLNERKVEILKAK